MIWCRFETNRATSYGIVEGETVTKVKGSPFEEHTVTSTTYQLDIHLIGNMNWEKMILFLQTGLLS